MLPASAAARKYTRNQQAYMVPTRGHGIVCSQTALSETPGQASARLLPGGRGYA